MSETLILIGQCQTKTVGALHQEVLGKVFIEKMWKQSKKNYLIDCSLSGCIIRERVVDFLLLALFKFCILGFGCIVSDVGFNLLTSANKALEPPQANGFHV